MCKKLVFSCCLAGLFTLALCHGAKGADPDLQGWWKLDGNALDSSGHGINGTVNGGPQWVQGVMGGALQCDGVDDCITLGNPSNLPAGKSPRSVCAWAMTNSLASTTAIILGYGTAATGQANGLARVSGTSFNGFGYGDAVSVTNFWQTGVWYHLCLTFDGTTATVYANGVPLLSQAKPNWNLVLSSAYIGQQVGGGQFWNGLIDDVRIYSRALTAKEIRGIMRGTPELAGGPQPENGAVDVPREVALSWTAGEFAQTHDVYLGTVFQDVNEAQRNAARGVLVSQGQTGAAYDPPGRLAFGTTYYWRIDEVNAPPDSTIFKGTTWSFTTEPKAYPVDGKTIKATASSALPNQGPENTINGSGLAADLHSSDFAAMWLTAADATGPAWIQYEFERVLKLDSLWVWNQDGNLESMLGLGCKEVVIAYSTDGVSFKTLGTTYEFARGPGAPGYAHNTTIDLGGIAAKYVNLTINSNWGGVLKQYGLSEVRFFSVPVFAREPDPKSGATGVDVDAVLNWRAGREAGQHQVLLGTDPNALAPAATTQTPSCAVAVNLDTTYYWRVVEVNNTRTPPSWPGDLWSFKTQQYTVVDDFESYTDDMDAGQAIFQTWVDGYGTTTNGSVIGNDPSPFAERTIINSGKQSMPYAYNNTTAPNSEATRTFASPQDWSQHGIKALTLRFCGDPANAAQQMYVKINSAKVSYPGAATDLLRKQWQMWYIDLTGMSVSSVKTLSVGLDRLAGIGGQGKVFIDDIRLYSYNRTQVTPVDPGTAGLQVQYQFEGNAADSSGKGRNGSFKGVPAFVAGKIGQAISLDGIDDWVNVDGYKGVLADAAGVQQPFTACAWIKTKVTGTDITAWGANVAAQRMELRVDTVLRVEHGGGNIRGTNGPSLLDDEWHHVAATVPQGGRIMDVRLYVDGADVTPASTTTAAFNIKANVDVAIGMGGPVGGRFFMGLVDEARLYDRALSPEEITWLAGRTTPFDKPF